MKKFKRNLFLKKWFLFWKEKYQHNNSLLRMEQSCIQLIKFAKKKLYNEFRIFNNWKKCVENRLMIKVRMMKKKNELSYSAIAKLLEILKKKSNAKNEQTPLLLIFNYFMKWKDFTIKWLKASLDFRRERLRFLIKKSLQMWNYSFNSKLYLKYTTIKKVFIHLKNHARKSKVKRFKMNSNMKLKAKFFYALKEFKKKKNLKILNDLFVRRKNAQMQKLIFVILLNHVAIHKEFTYLGIGFIKYSLINIITFH